MENLHYILSLDPGVTTGVAYAQYDTETMKLIVKVGQQKFSHDELYQFMKDRWESITYKIVYERFDYRNSYTKANLTPVEMIGVIKLFCERHSIKSYPQAPAVQGDHAYWSNEKLKEYSMYATGLEHGRSATKHLLYWWQFGAGAKYHMQPNFTNYELQVQK